MAMKVSISNKSTWIHILSVCTSLLAATVCGDEMLINQFVQSRYKFDRFLQTKKVQTEIDVICGQYSSSLRKLLDTIPLEEVYLRKCIDDELRRTENVRTGYLADAEKFNRVQLDHFWPLNLTHKEAVKDFRKVLKVKAGDSAPTNRPDIRGGFGEGAEIFGLPWLAHVDRFLERFKGEVKNKTGSKTAVSMPGFPKDSFFYYAFDGDFSTFGDLEISVPRENAVSGNSAPVIISEVGRFNRMHLVTDSRDQVVAVQFSCEAPRSEPRAFSSDDVGIFNFVLFRRKAIQTAAFYGTDEEKDFLKVTSVLKTTAGRLLEVNLLYLPNPTRELIEFVLSHPD
jgi:hypothetical protein